MAPRGRALEARRFKDARFMNSLSFQSAHTTCHPSDFRRLARCEPMKPAPPPMHTRRVGALSAIDAILLIPSVSRWVAVGRVPRSSTKRLQLFYVRLYYQL